MVNAALSPCGEAAGEGGHEPGPESGLPSCVLAVRLGVFSLETVGLFPTPPLGRGTGVPPPPIGMPEIRHGQGQPLDLLSPYLIGRELETREV